MNDIRVRFDERGGGASISVDGVSETYTFPPGNVVSRYGMLGLLCGEPPDGAEEIYHERVRARLLSQIHNHGVPEALRLVFDILPGDWQ